MIIEIVSFFIVLYIAYCGLLYFFQDRIMFAPTGELAVKPEDTALDIENEFIATENGEKINGWYMPAVENAEFSDKYVLFFHGNGGNMSHRVSTMALLGDVGINVLMIDYRGYGLSEGKVTESNLYEDARAAYQWLLKTKSAPADKIFLFGRSLGGAIAVDLATKVDCAGVIVESSFTSAADMGRARFPLVPVSALLRFRFDTIEKIDKVASPLLITHSPDDDLVPYKMGRRLYGRAKSTKEFLDLRGGHNELFYLETPEYISALRRFFAIGQ